MAAHHGIPCPCDSPGKNTGVGCHFLLQCMKVKSETEVTQLYPTLSDPMDCSLPGFSIHGIFQARVLEWGAIAFSGKRVAAAAAAKSLQSCPTLCDPIDGSPAGSPVPGIFQARTLECVDISFPNSWCTVLFSSFSKQTEVHRPEYGIFFLVLYQYCKWTSLFLTLKSN